MKKTILLIWGPTSVGKTDLSVKLALDKDAPVIALDRFQGYQEIEMGSGAPSQEELKHTQRYYLTDTTDALSHGIIDAQHANERAKDLATSLLKDRSTVIMEGGSQSLIQALIEDPFWEKYYWGIKLFTPPRDELFRQRIEKRVRQMLFPIDGRRSLLEEIASFFVHTSNVEVLADIDGYREIIQTYGRKHDFSHIHEIESSEVEQLIPLVVESYFKHAQGQQNVFRQAHQHWEHFIISES